jgi:hypothetical protein
LLYYFTYPSVTFLFLGSNIFLSALFSNILNLFLPWGDRPNFTPTQKKKVDIHSLGFLDGDCKAFSAEIKDEWSYDSTPPTYLPSVCW